MRLLDWTPDGRFLVYTANIKGESWLWRIPVEGGNPLRLPLRMDEARSLQIAPDGRHFAVRIGLGQASVWVLENFLPPPGVER